jgi:hypothetical protein
MIKKSLIAIMIVASISLFSGPIEAKDDKTFMVSPAKVEIQTKAGKSKTKTVKVVNQGMVPIEVTTDIADYYIRPDNTFVFSKPGHQSYSCAKWIKLDKTKFSLEPQEAKKVKITVAIPKNAELGGHYACVFFETIGQKAKDTGVGIIGRLGVLVLTSVGSEKDIVRKGEIRSFSVKNPWFSRGVDYRLTFHNSGNVHLTVKGFTTFKDIFGRNVGKANFEDITILPKTDRIMTTKWLDPPYLGFFRAKATVKYGPNIFTYNRSLTTKEITFWVIPWKIILAISALLVLVLIVRKIYLTRKASVAKQKVDSL